MRAVAALITGLVTAAPLLTACDAGSSGANASCVGPYLDAHPPGERPGGPPPSVRAGGDLTVYGHWFTSTCNDTGQDHEPVRPLPPDTLTLTLPGARPGGSVPLGTFTPEGDELGFAVTIHIPAHTPTGVARVADGEGRTFRFHVAAS